MNTPARIKAEPVPELLALVRALARADEARDYARLRQQEGQRAGASLR
jgi:hypothetical protein